MGTTFKTMKDFGAHLILKTQKLGNGNFQVTFKLGDLDHPYKRLGNYDKGATRYVNYSDNKEAGRAIERAVF